MKKILFITYYWPPSGGPGVQRSLKFVKYLVQSGIQPIVLSVDESKASYPILDGSLSDEIPDSVGVIKTNTFEPLNIYKRVSKQGDYPHSGFVNESNPGFFAKLSRFIRGNFFIPDARVGWNKHAYKAAKAILEQEKIDAVITSSPPHSTQLIGLKLKKKYNIKWIADLRDPWTDIYYYKEMMHLPFAIKKDAKFEKDVLENADKVITVSDDLKRILSTKIDSPEKIEVIYNGYDDTDFKTIERSTTEDFTIVYSGTIADSYNVNVFLNACSELIKDGFKIKLKFVGKVSENIRSKIEENGLSNYVETVGYLPHNESLKHVVNATALLLVIPEIENNKGIITGKIFEYLGSQRPIIGIGPVDGDAAKILEYCEMGKMFDYSDLNGINSYVSELIKMTDFKPNDKYKEFSRSEQTFRLAKLIHDLTID
jgi:glycosyltransferase involved in cell wall biosynthesis